MRFVLPEEKLLRGHVTDAIGRPVKGACVQVMQIARLDQLDPPDSTHPDCIYLDHPPSRPIAETNDDGAFAIAGLPGDVRATLRVSHDRFVLREAYAATTDMQSLEVRGDPRSGFGVNHWARSPDPVLTGDVVIRLESAGRLVGRVVYADVGKAARRAGVGLMSWPPEYAADDEGKFALGGLPPGKHLFRIYPPRGSEYLGITQELEIVAGKDVVRDFQLVRGLPVAGRVLDEATSKGVAGVGITYFAKEAGPMDGKLLPLNVETGPDGRFRTSVPPGTGELFVTAVPQDYAEIDVAVGRSITDAGARFRRAVDVASSEEVPEVEFRLARGTWLTGRVRDPTGKPAANVTIETRHYTAPNASRDLSRTTDANGEFRFGGLRELEYELFVRDRKRKLAAKTSVTPLKDRPARLDVQLQPMVKVTGRVRDDDGNPVADALVRLSIWDRRYGTTTPDIGHTDAQGLFTMDVLTPDAKYNLSVSAKGHVSVSSEQFEVKPGEMHALPDLTLKKADQSLAGVLISTTGKPLEGVIIRSETGGVSEARATDNLGRFRLTDLPRGAIQLWAWAPWIKDRSFPAGQHEAGNQNLRIELPVEDKKDP
jgi:hypothetical protein